ncbi:unnamed protein product [Larinioides sclopetarius]|uniref:Uncharacterized protein n=1 Tax=Larinioides sclopetarius TaxID=280406 RepID=A0AAV2A778_9ARAC
MEDLFSRGSSKSLLLTNRLGALIWESSFRATMEQFSTAAFNSALRGNNREKTTLIVCGRESSQLLRQVSSSAITSKQPRTSSPSSVGSPALQFPVKGQPAARIPQLRPKTGVGGENERRVPGTGGRRRITIPVG